MKRDEFSAISAAILDFFSVVVAGGYLVAALTGNLSGGGWNLEGGPALALFAVIIAYFVIGRRTGGTLWQRILKTRKPGTPR